MEYRTKIIIYITIISKKNSQRPTTKSKEQNEYAKINIQNSEGVEGLYDIQFHRVDYGI
jgi:hypothetical protein